MAFTVARLLLLPLLAVPPPKLVVTPSRRLYTQQFNHQTCQQFQLGLERADHGNEILTRSTHNVKHIQKDASLYTSQPVTSTRFSREAHNVKRMQKERVR